MDSINFEDFKKVDIRIGKIISAEKVVDSNKLLKLEVDFGSSPTNFKSEPENDDLSQQQNSKLVGDKTQRQIIAGIAKYYQPENLIGKLCPFVFNLESKMIGELESQGMILCADDNGPVLLHPDKNINPGSIVK